LNASGNSICKNPNYKNYILAHLRKLKYLDYRLVDNESSQIAREKYVDDLIALEEEEKVANDRKSEEERSLERAHVYERAHILGLDRFLLAIFQDDSEYERILTIDKMAIQEQREGDFIKKCEPIINELVHFALKRHSEQKMEVKQFQKCKQEAIDYHADICIELYNHYQHVKKQVFPIFSLIKPS
jgi:hypothetical protein